MVSTRYTLADSSKSSYSVEVATAGTAVSSTGFANFHFFDSGPISTGSAATEILYSFENSLLH